MVYYYYSFEQPLYDAALFENFILLIFALVPLVMYNGRRWADVRGNVFSLTFTVAVFKAKTLTVDV
jgi:hypothetical protein